MIVNNGPTSPLCIAPAGIAGTLSGFRTVNLSSPRGRLRGRTNYPGAMSDRIYASLLRIPIANSIIKLALLANSIVTAVCPVCPFAIGNSTSVRSRLSAKDFSSPRRPCGGARLGVEQAQSVPVSFVFYIPFAAALSRCPR